MKRWLCLAAIASALAACGDNVELAPRPDAGADATADAPVDAPTDAVTPDGHAGPGSDGGADADDASLADAGSPG